MLISTLDAPTYEAAPLFLFPLTSPGLVSQLSKWKLQHLSEHNQVFLRLAARASTQGMTQHLSLFGSYMLLCKTA